MLQPSPHHQANYSVHRLPYFWKNISLYQCACNLNFIIFVGSTDSLMKGSGFDEVLYDIYGDNTVDHILSDEVFAQNSLKVQLSMSAALCILRSSVLL